MGSRVMDPLSCDLHGLQDTEHLGRRIGACLRGGDVLALRGELGAGKTSLVNAIGESLGVVDIASPSFSLAHEHVTNSGLRLVHIDAWRIISVDELSELGWDDWIVDANTIICIEWGGPNRSSARRPTRLENSDGSRPGGASCRIAVG